MPKNDFKAFAISENANVLKQTEYELLPALDEGFQSGIARSEELNKVWRQASTITSVIASFMASKSGQDVLDNGDLNTLQNTLLKALLNNSISQLDDRYLNAELNLSDINNAKVACDNLGLTQTVELAAGALQKDKNLSDVPDKPNSRKNLGLGSAATYDVQASPADATPGKLVPIGGFGLGAENTPVANINADAMRVSGFYGGPGISGVNYYDPYAALLVMSRYNTDGGMMQISANGKVAVRGRGFDKLSNWNELFGKLNPPTAQDCNALPSDGTAVAANKLATARAIAGVSFDGTRNIDIPAGNVGAYTKAEVNSLIPTSSISGTSVKTFIWMGIMIQVGRVNGSVSSSTELTLPVAFKSYAQVLGSVGAASGTGVNAGVNMIGLGKIAFTRAGQYGPLTFLAIGDV